MNEIKLPPDIEFHDDIRLLIYRPRGLLSEQSVNRIVSVIEDLEENLQQPFNRFFDTLGHDEVELNFRCIIQISLHRVLSYLNRPPVKSAILATDNTIIHYCQLHAIITKDSPINVRIFKEREEAAQWLGVSLQRIAAKSHASERSE
jgi:precorrin-6x reductase